MLNLLQKYIMIKVTTYVLGINLVQPFISDTFS
jgi:hypothetical protein